MMVRKVLGILLCVGIVSLVSGCYCYPPGYHPGYGRHHSRFSYAYPSKAYGPALRVGAWGRIGY